MMNINKMVVPYVENSCFSLHLSLSLLVKTEKMLKYFLYLLQV
jgi:hypothetical protein